MKESWQFEIERGKVSIRRLSVMFPGETVASYGPYPVDEAAANLAIIALGFQPQRLSARLDKSGDSPLTEAAAERVALSLGYQPRRSLVRHELPFDQKLPAQRSENETLVSGSQA